MITEFVEIWERHKHELQETFSKRHPADYKELVTEVVKILSKGDLINFRIDPDRIHEIDDGTYHGTLIYIIGEKGQDPNCYWYVKVAYGSCSGCDCLLEIQQDSVECPNKEQVHDYMLLALHIVQGLKQIGKELAF